MSSKAAEILLNLNSQVKHTVPQASPAKNVPHEKVSGPSKKEELFNKAQQILNDPMSKNELISQIPSFSQKMQEQQNHQAPECLIEILTQQVGVIIPSAVSQIVESALKRRQKNAYESITGNEINYIQGMYDNSKQASQINFNLISNLMQKRSLKVEDDLETGDLEVIYEKSVTNKRQLELMAQLDVARMIKIKEGELRSKMEILHEKMSNLEVIENWNGVTPEEEQLKIEIQKKFAQSVDTGNYSLDSQKTKIAKDYVRYMHQQRKLFQKRKQERDARYAEHDKQRESDLQEAMEMKDLAKRQEILERIQKRRRRREEEQKEIETKEQNVHKFLSEYHRKNPIFKQKQKQFQERFLKPEQKFRQEKLHEIRQNRKSMSLNDIKHHQEKYMSKLEAQKIKRLEQFKLIMKSRQADDITKGFYKGQAHKRMDEITKEDHKRSQSLKEASKMKAVRMKEYSQVIHTKHKPNIDQEKRQQLMNFIENDILRKKRAKKVYRQVIDEKTKEVKLVPFYEALPDRDYKSEGKKYFIQAKKFIKKKDDALSERMDVKQQMKSSREARSRLHLLRSSDPELKRKDIWQVRAKNLEEMAGSNIIDAQNFQYVKHNIENLDKKAEQKEQLMKQIDLPMQQNIKQKSMLDHYYLQSIKQKMKLLQ